jgi:hypothetical protein
MTDTYGAAQKSSGPGVRLAGDSCTQFWRLAHSAISEGLLKREEACLVARVGHRKQIYWARHVRDLEALIARRSSETEGYRREKTDVQ